MPRPLPTLPHGPRRRRDVGADRLLLLACPRVSPEWELRALRVLMKPHDWTRRAVGHRAPAQQWPRHAAERVEEARRIARERIDFHVNIHLPQAGDFFLLAEVAERRVAEGRAFALVLSRRLPGLWFAFDRLFARDGRLFRRERRFKFDLVEAKSVHLPRAVRAALRDVL